MTLPIIVIGAGIIGTAIAFELRRRGRTVVLIDRGEPGRGCSFGNMASIALTEFLPASRPSIWAQLPRWILPNGPVKLRIGYLPRLAPWLLRFLLSSRPSKMRQLEDAGAALCARVSEDLMALLSAAGLRNTLSTAGCISLYATDGELRADCEHLKVLKRYGIVYEHLDRAGIDILEPAVGPKIARAILFPENRTIADPYKLVLELVNRFVARGGRSEIGDVVSFELTEHGHIAGVRLRDGRCLSASAVVAAAGAHTSRLSKVLGEAIPLETERGYHTQIMDPGLTLRHSLIWASRAFMVSPVAGGVRVGGSIELAGLDAPPDYRRAKVLVAGACEMLPALKVRNISEWMGHRPALPDTVPVIGPSAKVRGVFYATGHGHLGLTYAATTARLMSDLMTGQETPLNMTPYRVDRF